MVAQFRHQHGELIDLAEGIMAAARAGRADDLARLRLAFARAVKEHVEDEAVAVQKAIGKGLLCAEMVDGHNRLVMRWRADVALCNSDWPTSRAVEEPHGFLGLFRPLVAALRTAVDFEEQQLLAPIAKAA
jgi:class 3 adenylate cyclase